MEKIRSERANDFKKKNSGIDKRSLRAHRRSIEWKQMRDQTVNMKRGGLGSPLSPLKEVQRKVTINKSEKPSQKKQIHQNVNNPKPSQKKQTAAESRKEMLEKWKREKELKKKLDAQENAKKKPFKVTHFEPSCMPFKVKNSKPKVVQPTKDARHLTKTKPVTETRKVQTDTKTRSSNSSSNKKQETRRITRSQANSKNPTERIVVSHKASKTSNKVTGKEIKSSHTKTKTLNDKVEAVKKPKQQGNMAKKETQPETKKMDSIRKTRGDQMSSIDYSFAPTDFKFTAPSHLKSYSFQPLSPGSAASFLFSNKDLSVFSPPSTRRCSTPKLISNNPRKLRQSPQASAITELTSGSSDGETEKVRAEHTRSPVMSLIKQSRAPHSKQQKDNTVVEEIAQAIQDHVQLQESKLTISHKQDNQSLSKTVQINEKSFNLDGNLLIAAPTKLAKTPRRKSARITKTESLPEELLCGKHLTSDNSENVPPPADNVFVTPSHVPPRGVRSRTRSLGTTLMLSNSSKKFKTPKNNRNSLILRTLSPDEGIEVLKQSPMIELTRRTPKSLNQSTKSDQTVDPLPTFCDIEEELKLAASPTHKMHKTSEQNEKDCIALPPCSSVIPTVENITNMSTEETSTISNSEEKHDVPYFRKLLVTETNKLNKLCDKWNIINTNDLIEEASGHIRTAIGKAQLLIAQRFKQFLGLVDDCDYKTGEKETTCQDLQGFWDMIFFQIEDVNSLFEELDKKQANNWKECEVAVVNKKTIKKKTSAIKGCKPTVKSKFAAFKAKMKQHEKGKKEAVEQKTFEGGFFNIESPVKSEGKIMSRRSKSWSRNNTPVGSPLHKAVIERVARKTLIESPKVVNNQSLDCKSGSKRKRVPTGSDSPAKVLKLNAQTNLKESSSIFTPEDNLLKQSLRRSLRKSVCWNTDEHSQLETTCPVTDQTSNTSFSKFFIPTQSNEDMDVDHLLSPHNEDIDMASQSKRALHNEFDKQSNSSHKKSSMKRRSVSTPSSARQLSSTTRSASGRRKSRRSVHFSVKSNSPPSGEKMIKHPVTPFSSRERKASPSQSNIECDASLLIDTTESNVDSPVTRMAKLNMDGTPKRRSMRNRRISGFTPPQSVTSPVSRLSSLKEDQSPALIDLMCFSPLASSNSNENTNASNFTPIRSRRSTRQSLL